MSEQSKPPEFKECVTVPVGPNHFYAHVWIHGDAETGKPHSVDVFEVIGRVHFTEFCAAFEDDNGPDLAYQFYEYLEKVNESAWFLVEMMTETALDFPEYYIRVHQMLQAAPQNPRDGELARLEREIARGAARNSVEEWITHFLDGECWSRLSNLPTKDARLLDILGELVHHPTDPNLVRLKAEVRDE